MSSQLSRLCSRISYTALAKSYPQIVNRNYCRWVSRRPSKATYPTVPSVTTENVIDLTEHYAEKEHRELTNFEKGTDDSQDGAFLLKKANKPKKEVDPEPTVPKKDLFDLDIIDAQTHGLNVKKVIREKVNKESSGSLKFSKRKKQPILKTEPLVSIDVFDSKGKFVYEKLPYKDAVIGHRIFKLKSKKDRERMNQFLVEGWRLIADGLQAGCELDTVIFSQLDDLERLRPFMPQKGVKLYKMPYNEMKMWSTLDTCPGFIGIFKMPRKLHGTKEVFPINIICDNLREPGNLGSLLRNSLGAGCSSVFLTKGCVDMWDSKVLRSACGAHFKLSVMSGLTWDEIPDLIDTESTVLIADNNTDKKILVSSKKASQHNEEEQDSDQESSDDCRDSHDEEIHCLPEIPVNQYYKLDYARMKSITLIVGGETEGISEECYRFAIQRNGTRINIPLQAGVDSLNSSMAFGVIAFEIRKQLMEAGIKPLKITAKG